jgi:GNAT superfamily N-acetyltransferase
LSGKAGKLEAAGERERPAIRPLTASDDDALRALMLERWDSTRMVSRGRVWEIPDLPGFVAEGSEGWISYGHYRVEGDSCEVVMLDSPRPGHGGASAVLAAIADTARAAGCRRLWLVTTNDNLHALGFYQRRGFALSALHRDAVTEARRTLKPEIGLMGENRIPIRDEIELELLL